jgi:hypothetical protein
MSMQTIVYQCDTAMPAQKLPNCCVYTCIEKGLMKELHCYVCVCKSNKWLIDSKKRKWGDDTKWSNIYL